jgi:hypothetical protein
LLFRLGSNRFGNFGSLDFDGFDFGDGLGGNRIPKESREDMMFQTQSKSYQEWMKEDAWDQAVEALPAAATLPLDEFKA